MRRKLVLTAAATALLMPLVAVSAPAAQAAGTGVDRLVLTSEADGIVARPAYRDEAVLTVDPGPGARPTFTTAGWRVELRSPDGVTPLTVGLYEGATRAGFGRPGEPGLSVSGEGIGCESLGRFRVDQADYDSSGALVAFAARFEHHCDASTQPALFGSVAWHATVPVFGHRLSVTEVAFGDTSTGGSSAPVDVTVTNTSIGTLPVSSVAPAGPGADQFAVVRDGCSGVTLAADAVCTVSLAFRPTRPGGAGASLVVLDALTDWASPPVGQRVRLAGRAMGDPLPPPSSPVGGEFHPLAPARILDTRTGAGTVAVRPLRAGETITFAATGVGGVPAAGVSAVVVNLTAAEATTGGWLALHPSDEPWPGSSSVNFGPGESVPNMAIMAVGADGRLALRNCCGDVHAVVDVVGWYGGETDAPALAYDAVTPTRVLDTRTAARPVGAGESRVVPLTGAVPASAEAVVVNLTATDPTAPTYVTAYPTGTDRPTASSLNVVAGETRPNLVTVKLGVDGSISLYNFAGSTHLVVDVVGYYGPSRSPRGRVLTGTPARLFDTRIRGPKPGPNSIGYLDVTGTDGCVHVEAVILNITATEPTAPTFLTVYPDDGPRPVASNLNVVAGQTSANLVMAKVPADGIVNIYNLAGSVHVIGDLVGIVTKEDAGGGACAVRAFDAAPVTARFVPASA